MSEIDLLQFATCSSAADGDVGETFDVGTEGGRGEVTDEVT